MRTLLVILLLSAASLPASAEAMRNKGWWVVLTSIKDDGTMRPHNQMEAFARKMRECSVEVFGDYSAKFSGFTPGYLVAVLGAYATEREAKAQLPNVAGCVKGAYVKRGEHAGE